MRKFIAFMMVFVLLFLMTGCDLLIGDDGEISLDTVEDLLDDDEIDDAVDMLEDILDEDDEDFEAWEVLIEVLIDEEEYDDAIDALEDMGEVIEDNYDEDDDDIEDAIDVYQDFIDDILDEDDDLEIDVIQVGNSETEDDSNVDSEIIAEDVNDAWVLTGGWFVDVENNGGIYEGLVVNPGPGIMNAVIEASNLTGANYDVYFECVFSWEGLPLSIRPGEILELHLELQEGGATVNEDDYYQGIGYQASAYYGFELKDTYISQEIEEGDLVLVREEHLYEDGEYGGDYAIDINALGPFHDEITVSMVAPEYNENHTYYYVAVHLAYYGLYVYEYTWY